MTLQRFDSFKGHDVHLFCFFFGTLPIIDYLRKQFILAERTRTSCNLLLGELRDGVQC